MNQRCHKIVFNARRGQAMAVSEAAGAQQGSHTESGTNFKQNSTQSLDSNEFNAILTIVNGRSLRCHASGLGLRTVLGLSLGWAIGMGLPATTRAQVVVDAQAPASQRPTLQNSANGLTQVDIQTPSAQGVSHSRYTQFDVPAQGIILNNSHANVLTQTGGWVTANPWLAGGAARLILNEVNSTQPSVLKGFVEVAGQRAEVVVANPSGITVNGGGFINANRVTLTTGRPMMVHGDLAAFEVQDGAIHIDGAGLNNNDANYTAILSRAAYINAGVWGKTLKVITGENEIDASNLTVTALTSGRPQPAFSLDVSHLGGMYANHIHLIGTAAGVGVRNAGTLAAQAGDVLVQANGRLVNSGTLQAQGNMQLQAQGDIDATGSTISATGALTATTPQTLITNQANVTAGHLQINAHDLSNVEGKIVQTGLGDIDLDLAGDLDNTRGLIATNGLNIRIHADRLVNARGRLEHAGTGRLLIEAKLLSDQGGCIESNGTVEIGASQINHQDACTTAQHIIVTANDIDNSRGNFEASQDLKITATHELTNTGIIDSGDTQINAETLNNTGTGKIYGDHLSIAAGTVNNTEQTVDGVSSAGTLAARNRLDIGAQTLNNQNGALIFSAGDMATGGALDGERRVTGTMKTLTNDSATVQALGELTMNADTLVNKDSHFESKVVVDSITPNKSDYDTVAGLYTSEQAGWMMCGSGTNCASNPNGRRFVVPASSPYAKSVFASYFTGPNAYVPKHQQSQGHGEYTTVSASFAYSKDASIWRDLGLANPTNNPPSGSPPDAMTCNDDCEHWHYTDPQGMDAWNAAAAPWIALQSRLDAMRANVLASRVEITSYRNYTETLQHAEVLSAAPANILAGGGMTLNATTALTNDKSNIVAGGDLNITGAQVDNIGEEVNAPTLRRGSITVREERTESCLLGGCGHYYEWPTYGYNLAIDHKSTLAVATVQDRVQGTEAAKKLEPNSKSQPSAASALAKPVPASTVVLPNSSLFRTNPQATAGFVVETDPRFANYRDWLGSDYMLRAMAVDPATAQKRLGDGFYEQRLITEQVLRLSGQRYLADYTSDETQYQALMDAGVTFAKAQNLRPGISLSAAHIAQLTSDIVWLESQSVTLPDGSTTIALVPQVYMAVKPGDLAPTGALLGGSNVNINVSGALNNRGGSVLGRKLVNLNANTLNNSGGQIGADVVALQTVGDLNNVGARVQAQSALMAQAGGDLNVQSTVSQASSNEGGKYSLSVVDRVAGLYVTGGADASGQSPQLIASAGRNLTVQGAQIASAGNASLSAGNDLNLSTLQTHDNVDVTRDERNYARFGFTAEVGSQLQAQNLTLSASRDLTLHAAEVQAADTLALQSGRDVSVQAGQSSKSSAYASYSSGSGLLGGASTETRISHASTDVQGSNLGAKTITIHSGQDTTVRGSQIVSDSATTVNAARDLRLEAAQTSYANSYFSEQKSSGFSIDGPAIFIGDKQQSLAQNGSGTGAVGSTVGSIGGNTTLVAGHTYTQTGSDVVAPGGDINITAQNIAIKEAQATDQQFSEQKTSQSGLTIALSNPMMSAMQGMMATAQNINQVKSGRMKALGAATMGLQAYGAYQATQPTTGKDGTPQDPKAASVGISISYGQSESTSTQESKSTSAQGSSLTAGHDITLTASDPLHATGGGNESNILIQGSSVQAAHEVSLNADNQIALLAAQSTQTQRSDSQSSGSSIGVSLTVGKSMGFSVSASANGAYSSGRGDGVSYTNTRVEGANAVNLNSGGNTTLKGGVIAAKTVNANVGTGADGGNLVIDSPQDASTYDEHGASWGVTGSVGFGVGATNSFSVSLGKTDISSNYRSTSTQSGIRAGDGGFNVNVAGDTTLTAGVITSSDKAVQKGKNSLVTSTLSTSDLQNQSQANVSSSGFTLGSDMFTQGKYGIGKGVIGDLLDNASASDSSNGESRSAVSEARVTITDNAKQLQVTGKSAEETVASLNHDTAHSNTVVQKLDAQAMLQAVVAERAIKTQAFKQLTTFTDEAWRTMYKAGGTVFRVPPGCKDKSCAIPLTEQEARQLKNSQDGMLHLSNNGIFNDLDGAVKYAQQHGGTINDDGSKDYSEKPTNQYIIVAPQADNVISELMVAFMQKSGLTPYLGVTRFEDETAKIIESATLQGQSIVIDSHSRGSLTTTNAQQMLINQGGIKDNDGNPIPPNIKMYNYGPAQNNITGNQTLQELTSNDSAVINSTVHPKDLIGTVVGNNATTSTYVSTGADGDAQTVSSLDDGRGTLGNAKNILTGTATPHNCYGSSAEVQDCDKQWNNIPQVTPATQQPPSTPTPTIQPPQPPQKH